MHFMKHLFPGDTEVDFRRVLPTEHVAEQIDDGQIIAVGRYRIGMAVSDDLKLMELSEKECQEKGINLRQKHFHVPPPIFLGFRWRVIVGAVSNTVVNLKATTSTETITETIQAVTLVQEYCSERLGVPEERRSENAFCLWRSNNTQVMYQAFPPWPYRHEISITCLRPLF